MKINRTNMFVLLAFLVFGCAANKNTAAYKNTVDVLEIYKKTGNDQKVQKDYSIKARQYQLEADKGNSKAMLQLGLLYAHGLGVSKSYPEALKWFRLAADKGEAKAMHNDKDCIRSGAKRNSGYDR